jgi:hypothetical protein
MTLIRCEKYPPFAFTYNAHHTVCAVWTMAPVKPSVIAVVQILSWMLKSTYLRFYCLSVENAILVILHICCQIKRVSSCLRYVNHDRGQMRYSYFLPFGHQYSNERISDAIGGLSTNRCVLYFTFAAKYRAQYPVYAMPTMVPVYSNTITFLHIQPQSPRLPNVYSSPSQIQYSYISWYSGFNVQLNVPCSILVICRQFKAHYTPHLLRNTGHSSRFAPCQLWYRSNPILVHFLLLQASIFNLTYLLRYLWYVDISMRVMIHICCEMQPMSTSLRYVKSGPSQTQ